LNVYGRRSVTPSPSRCRRWRRRGGTRLSSDAIKTCFLPPRTARTRPLTDKKKVIIIIIGIYFNVPISYRRLSGVLLRATVLLLFCNQWRWTRARRLNIVRLGRAKCCDAAAASACAYAPERAIGHACVCAARAWCSSAAAHDNNFSERAPRRRPSVWGGRRRLLLLLLLLPLLLLLLLLCR